MRATVTISFPGNNYAIRLLPSGGDLHILGETLNTEYDFHNLARDYALSLDRVGECTDDRLDKELKKLRVAGQESFDYLFHEGDWYVRKNIYLPTTRHHATTDFMLVEKALNIKPDSDAT